MVGNLEHELVHPVVHGAGSPVVVLALRPRATVQFEENAALGHRVLVNTGSTANQVERDHWGDLVVAQRETVEASQHRSQPRQGTDDRRLLVGERLEPLKFLSDVQGIAPDRSVVGRRGCRLS